MRTASQRLTADELRRMPDDGLRHELIRGELRTMPPPGYLHGRIVAAVAASLSAVAGRAGLGVVLAGDPGFLLATEPDHLRAPDVAFLRAERAAALGEHTGYVRGAPDLAVAVLSPADRPTEVDAKIGDWLAGGAAMVVVIDPGAGAARVHRPGRAVAVVGRDGVLDGAGVVPGWRLPLAELLG